MTESEDNELESEFEERQPRTSNIEFLTELMSFSPHGALVQAFVIEAIRSYSAHIVEAEIEYNPNALIDPATWQAIGKDVLRQIEEKYGKVD